MNLLRATRPINWRALLAFLLAFSAPALTTCTTFLKSSEKAQQQWELDCRFTAFESGF